MLTFLSISYVPDNILILTASSTTARRVATGGLSLGPQQPMLTVYPQVDTHRGFGFALRCSFSLPTTNEQNVPTKANQLANFPLNFLRTGYYNPNGSIYRRTAYSAWWTATQSDMKANYLISYDNAIDPQRSYERGIAFALHCVIKNTKPT